MTAGAASVRASILDRLPRGARAVAWTGVVLGMLAFFVALPPIAARSPVWPILFGLLGIAAGIWAVTRGVGRLAWGAIALGVDRDRPRLPGDALRRGEARQRRRVVGALRGDAPLRDAAHVRGDRRHVQRARRRREHRPRGDDADGRVLRDPRRGQARLVAARAPRRARRGRADGADPRVRLDPSARGPDRERHGDQLPRARASPATSSSTSTATRARRAAGSLASRRSTSASSARFRASERSSRTCSAT